jgi:hypothetical protein
VRGGPGQHRRLAIDAAARPDTTTKNEHLREPRSPDPAAAANAVAKYIADLTPDLFDGICAATAPTPCS